MATGNPNGVPMGSRTATHIPGGESQGGGFRGGPKRWTGKGPAPARHIPWPEIFEHHISVIKGHLKMVEMVRKHTVEGSGNWRTITDVCHRAQEMLKASRQISNSFVPPKNQREQVPLGVSSDSMYPGYSPADHEYGKAAEEYGRAVAEAKRRGVEIPKHPDIDYQVGQARGTKRKPAAELHGSGVLKGQQAGRGSGSGEGSAEKGPAKKQKGNEQVKAVEKEAPTGTGEAPEGDNPFFIIDTKPATVSIPSHLSTLSPTKRAADAEPSAGIKSKKSKKQHEGDGPAAPGETEETEDISAEVEARLKEKEEKRKRKDQKKRKRESDKSDVAAATAITAETTTAAAEAEKPKKKKKKLRDAEADEGLADRLKREGEEGEEGGKKKKRKKSKN